MPTCSQQSDAESRYALLLQPIRDIAKNWEVDIAAYLDDYLDELDKITISFDGGATTMNFAEAALLIQGTVCVYSKKVEYLYTLVYQVMDLLANKKKLQQQAEKESHEKNPESVLMHTTDDEFLSLDDITAFKEVQPVDKQLINESMRNTTGTPRVMLTELPHQTNCDKPATDGVEELVQANLFSVSMGSSFGPGITLLDACDMTHPAAAVVMMSQQRVSSQVTVPAAENTDDNGCTANVPAMTELQDITNDDNDNMGLEAGEPMQEQLTVRPSETIEENHVALRRRFKDNIVTIPQRLSTNTHQDLETELLDPHKPTVDQPRKKGCVWKVPARIKELNGRKRSRGQQIEKRISIGRYCQQEFTKKPVACEAEPLKATSYLQFVELFEMEKARRQAVQRQCIKRLSALEWEEGNDKELIYDAAAVHDADADDNDDDHAIEGGDDVPAAGVDWVEQLNGLQLTSGLDRFEEPQQPFTQLDNVPVLSSYEELVAQYTEGFFSAAQQFIQSTELTQRIEEWERKILPKLKEEEERVSFDIHHYGTYILDTFGDEAEEGVAVRSLHSIVNGKPAYEVCRYFSAMLQLANVYNVEIINKKQAMDKVSLRLLSKRRHFEELAEYRVPSMH